MAIQRTKREVCVVNWVRTGGIGRYGVATRSELKAANKKLFGKKSSSSFITKNKAFQTDVRGLYSLVVRIPLKPNGDSAGKPIRIP